MSLLNKLALGALMFNAAEGARVRRSSVNTKHIAGVPVHSYNRAFDQGRWDESLLQAMEGELAPGKERWLVMMRAGISEAELEAVCSAHASCDLHGHSGAVPFLELRASEKELEQLLATETGKVEFVEPDLPMSATPELPSTEAEVPWGLRRVRSRSLSDMPSGNPGRADGGEGVHVYVLDTGIRVSHSDFGGRASPAIQMGSWFFSPVKECDGDTSCAADKQGHGTHCAGTVGGASYGVAKKAQLHAVKVLSDSGSGSTGGIVKGMDWVAEKAQRPAIASMSLGGGRSSALNSATDAMTAAGVTVVTASGNSNTDGCTFSPGSAATAINVGSTTASDERSSFSNYGTCLDIWAPGSAVLSAGHGSDGDAKTFSGTSMACPHVAGAAALLLQAAPGLSPEEVKAKLVADATSNVVTGVPGSPASPNLLLYVA